MSELAKFVAAVLKEKVAVDLEEENERLQGKVEALESERAEALEYASRNGRVEITGKGGSPVYAHGEMKNVSSEHMEGDNDVYLISPDPTLCPIGKLLESELRLNGMRIGSLNKSDSFDNITGYAPSELHASEETHCVVQYVFEHHGVVGGVWDDAYAMLIVEFGPIPVPAESPGESFISKCTSNDFRDEEIEEVKFSMLILRSNI